MRSPPIRLPVSVPVAAQTLSLDSAGGVRLHASLFGAPHPVAGLLIVHGLQSHAGWFEASGTAAELAGAGITCLAYDRRGSGRSSGVSGHADSCEDFIADLRAAAAALRVELDRSIGSRTPMHVLANCFGTRAVLAYLADDPSAFDSLILTSPATHMSRKGSYGLLQRLSILLSPSRYYFPTPLQDDDFLASGPWLEWIRRDRLGLRRVTAGFLRSANRLTPRMKIAAARLHVPLLVVLSRRDRLVVNDAVRAEFVESYPGPKQVVEYDTDHYVDFSDARAAFERQLEQWVLVTAPALSGTAP